MKKPLLVIIIILVVVLAIPAVSFIRWAFQEKKPMNILILDKTVPTLDRNGHRSLVYVLTNDRFVRKDKGGSFSTAKDYYGFIPLRPVREKQFKKKDFRLTELIDLAENNDAIYFADTYGVFFNDWYQGIKKARRSRKLYGGLNNNDYLLMSEMKKRDKLVIVEYNTFNYPTAGLERFKVEELLGLSSTGWTGKYYRNLDTVNSAGVPSWMPSLYRKQYNEPWKFTKPGVVLLKENSIIVLEEGKQLTSAKPVIVTPENYTTEFQVIPSVAFENEFEIVNPGENTVISSFSLRTTASGDTLLSSYGLSSTFPASLRDQAEHTFYFSGDFTNNSVPSWTSRLKGIEKAKTFLYTDNQEDYKRFFWLYYKPLITGIMTGYLGNEKK